ncbi:MAG: Ig-like domain-containing protein, partial [Nitrososphaera sp.]
TVTPVNDAPTIIDGALGSISVDEDSSVIIDIISNVFDPEGDSIMITNITQPSHGTAVLNPDNSVTYTPDPNYNGQDSFDFTVSDGNGGEATGTVTITVGAVNDVPLSNDGSASVDEDTASDIQLNATDVDGDSMTFTMLSMPSHGAAIMTDSVNGIVEYTTDLNYNGPDLFTFQTTDGTADSNIATISITVNAVNDDPTANDDNSVGTEDNPVALNVLANDLDVEGDALTVDSIPQDPAHGIAVINGDNTITYTPELDFNGTDSFEYRIQDGNGGSSTGTVTITIGAVNDAPVSDDGSATSDEDSFADIVLNATDSDGDTLSYSVISMPSHGTLEVMSGDGGLVRYTPAANFNGNDEFSFQTTDGIADSNIATVSVTVNP